MQANTDASVALHPEGVDRNQRRSAGGQPRRTVALHPEGVDRNIVALYRQVSGTIVALHPEGVDRNPGTMPVVDGDIESPSTRRAWIEI